MVNSQIGGKNTLFAELSIQRFAVLFSFPSLLILHPLALKVTNVGGTSTSCKRAHADNGRLTPTYRNVGGESRHNVAAALNNRHIFNN